MAVYERSYKRYEGRLTPQSTRWSVIPRFSFAEIFSSKPFLAYFILCMLPPLFLTVRIYLYHNAARIFEGLPNFAEFFSEFLAIDAKFFAILMIIQCALAFIAAMFVGPGLISKDLTNNALPLYLSRPISRAEYVFGKFSVLGILLSLITWIPGLFLYFLQSNFAGWGWAFDNIRLALGVFISSWAWIITVSFLALALSAWVKWRAVASFLMFAVFLGGGFFGLLINTLFQTDLGNLVNLMKVIGRIWEGLFGLPPEIDMPVWAAWCSLLTFIGACLYLLHRKIRAYEVIT